MAIKSYEEAKSAVRADKSALAESAGLDFVHEFLPTCEKGIPDIGQWEIDVQPCGEPATCRVRWGDGDWLYLCEKHEIEVMQSPDEGVNVVSPTKNAMGITRQDE